MVTVRAATPADYCAIQDLTRAAYITSGHVDPDSPYARTLTDIQARTDGLHVAEVDGQIAGSVNIALPGSSMAEIADTDELEFRMLAVHPDFQGRGIGRILVEYIVQLGRQRDLDAVAITTMRSMTTAQAMYTALGFHRVPDRDWNLHTAGVVDDPAGLESFLVYVYPLNSKPLVKEIHG